MGQATGRFNMTLKLELLVLPLVFLLSTGSAVVALDWRQFLKGDTVEPVTTFIANCTIDQSQCENTSYVDDHPICTANYDTCIASKVAASAGQGQKNYGLDDMDPRITIDQHGQIVDAYTELDSQLAQCFGEWNDALSDDRTGCMANNEMGSPEFLQCVKDKQYWVKRGGCYNAAFTYIKTTLNGI